MSVLKACIAFLATLVLFFAAWMAAEVLIGHRVRPPESARTLSGWLAWQPEAQRCMVAGDGQHFMALGDGAGLVPSGPSVYVFDSDRLVDWTGDLGDDPEFARRWSITYPLRCVRRVAAEGRAARTQLR